jgi:hypothetical protein
MLFEETAAFAFADVCGLSNIIQRNFLVLILFYECKNVTEALQMLLWFRKFIWLCGEILVEVMPNTEK